MKAKSSPKALRWPPLIEAHLSSGVRRLKTPITRSTDSPHIQNDDSSKESSSPLAGVCETYQGIVTVGNDDFEAYIKVLGVKGLVNELLAASIGRALELPIPDFFLVRTEPETFKDSLLLAEIRLPMVSVFAMRAVSSSPLERRITGDEREMWQTLAAMSGIQDAVVFDEWVANGDRHSNNVLLAPDEFWLIDHEQCFTGRDWRPSDLIASGVFPNLLATALLQVMSDKEKGKLSEAASKMGSQCEIVAKRAASSGLLKQSKKKYHLTAKEADALSLFLSERVAHIESLISNRVGYPAPPRTTLSLVS